MSEQLVSERGVSERGGPVLVVLAAGAGRRMGGPKAELVVGGVRLLDRAVQVGADAGCRVLAVVRPGTVVPGAAVAVPNPDADSGLRSSLAAAVAALGSLGSVGSVGGPGGEPGPVAVLPVDVPGVGAAAVRTALAAWRPGRIAVACFADRSALPEGSGPAGGAGRPEVSGPPEDSVPAVRVRRGHPVVAPLSHWRAALALAAPDEGARRYLAAHPDLVDEVLLDGDPTDLDTPDDLAGWTTAHP